MTTDKLVRLSDVTEAIDKMKTGTCFDKVPSLTSHDNTGFWMGVGYAEEVLLSSLQSVETPTSDTKEESLENVLASLPDEFELTRMDDGNYWCWDKRKRLAFCGHSKCPKEAALALREKLNSK